MFNSIIKFILWFFLAAFLFNFWQQLFNFPYVESGDGLSLFNPVYMGTFYNRIVYPAYYHFDSMPIHPPTYYYILSLLYKTGMPVFYIIKAPVFFSVLIFGLAVVLSRLSYTAKFAALFAVILAFDRTGAFITFRPDIVLSLLFLTSLVCLHEGTHTSIKPNWLLAGSILIGLSSTMHYFSIMGFAGLAFFSIKIRRRDDYREHRRALIYLVLPAIVIVGYYLLFVILPNASEVLGEIAGASNNFQQSAVAVHYRMYHDAFSNELVKYPLLILPVAGWLLIGSYLIKEMRTVYLASIPFILFVFLVPAGKSAGYYIVEFAMLFWLVTDIALRVIFSQLRRLKPVLRNSVTILLLIYVGFISACSDYQIDRHKFEVVDDAKGNGCEMFTARACGKQILGADAKVGGRLIVWFNTGAARWYQFTRDIFFNDSIENKNISTVFKRFDAVAEYRHFGNMLGRTDRYSLPQWYVDDTLQLKGFYMSNNFKPIPYFPDNDAPYLLFSSYPSDSVKGYMVYNNEQITAFVEDSIRVDNYFLSLVLNDSAMNYALFDSTFEMYTRFIYPDRNGGNDKWLVWGVAKKTEPALLFEKYKGYARIKDLIPLRKQPIAKQQLLDYEDTPVKFYNNLESVSGDKPYYELQSKRRVTNY